MIISTVIITTITLRFNFFIVMYTYTYRYVFFGIGGEAGVEGGFRIRRVRVELAFGGGCAVREQSI